MSKKKSELLVKYGDVVNMIASFNGTEDLKLALLNRLDRIPTIDLVRCKECKWLGKLGCAIAIADESDKPKQNDFCSFAERTGNDGK